MRTPVATAFLVVLLTAGCSGGSGDPDDGSSDATATGVPSPTATASDPAEPGTGTLDWQPTGASPEQRRTVGAEWTAVLDDAGSRATFTGPQERVVEAAGGTEIVEVLLEGSRAVVVSETPDGEVPEGQPLVRVVDLESGEETPVDALPGSFALEDGVLHHPAAGEGGAYCLAATDVESGETELTAHCAAPDDGFAAVSATPSGVTLMTFDDARPVSCRTLVWLTDAGTEPLPGVAECTGWDSAATEGGVAWSQVPKPARQEVAEFLASHDGTVVELGRGATGSLTPCGDSVFFTRDSRGGDPARLLRWTADGTLEVAYEAEAAPSFLTTPTCADGILTMSVYAESGDEQLSASVG